MTLHMRIGSALAGGALLLAIGVPAARAELLHPTKVKCFQAVAKAGGKLFAKALKATQKCLDKSLKNADPGDDCSSTVAECVGGANAGLSCTVDSECPDGSCVTGEPAITIANLVLKSDATIDKKCSFLTPAELGPTSMQFPGKCFDPDVSDGFTSADLKYCIRTTHPKVAEDLIGLQYGSTTGPLDKEPFKCLQTIAKNGAKFASAKLKAIQKCRDGLLKGKLLGFLPANCDTADSKTKAKIDKAESKTRAKIFGKCSDPNIAALTVCSGVCIGGANNGQPCSTTSECPGGTCGPASTETEAEDCIIKTHGEAVDSKSLSAVTLIDFEYTKQPVCGDNVTNGYEEECDGSDDTACPGQCGAVTGVYETGSFPCLCINKKRQRVIEHSNADSDDGWTGISHDRYLVEGGGYQSDLYDCDGPLGPDTLCTVGPSCTVGTCEGGTNGGGNCTAESACPGGTCSHARCANDGQCGTRGPCRKERTAAGPHCNLDIKHACSNNADCPGGYASGNHCVKTYHGPPLPLSAGGVSVCVENVFTEDVFGTVDLATGEASMRYHQDTITHFGPTIKRPCPTCGGFCGAPPNGDRRPCTTDADCTPVPGSPPCVTDLICSGGTNIDQPCRTEFPFGATNPLFGTTSLDCLPNTQIVANLDLTFDDRTTDEVTLLPSIQCEEPAFDNKVCMGGTNNGRPCTSASECDSGTCSHQCPCPGGGATKTRPNMCETACLGGGNDANPCTVDSQCPGGFCHKGDCRLDVSAIVCRGGSNDGAQCTVDSECPSGVCFNQHEGSCSIGPVESICSFNHEKSCSTDADCVPPGCSFCEPDETCLTTFQNCFETTGIIREGLADPVNPTTVAADCSGPAIASSVNTTSGLPGPTTNRFPEKRITTGF